MTDRDIFNYQMNATKKVLSNYNFTFSDNQLKNITNDLKEVNNNVLKKYQKKYKFVSLQYQFNEDSLYNELRRVYFKYLINNLIRYLTKKGLKKKQIWQINEDVAVQRANFRCRPSAESSASAHRSSSSQHCRWDRPVFYR